MGILNPYQPPKLPQIDYGADVPPEIRAQLEYARNLDQVTPPSAGPEQASPGVGIGHYQIPGKALDFASPGLLSYLRSQGPAVQHGHGHDLANILSVIGQTYLGSRMAASADREKSHAEDLALAKEQRGELSLERRSAGSIAAKSLADWRHYGKQAAALTPDQKVELTRREAQAKIEGANAGRTAGGGLPIGAPRPQPKQNDNWDYVLSDDPYGGKFMPQSKLVGLTPPARTAAMDYAHRSGVPLLNKGQEDAANAIGTMRDNIRTMLSNIDLLPDSKNGLDWKRFSNPVEAATGFGAAAPRLRTLRQSMDATYQGARALAGGAGSGVRSSKDLMKLSNQINAFQPPDTRQMAVEQAKVYKEYANNVARHLGLKSVPGQGQDELDDFINGLVKNPNGAERKLNVDPVFMKRLENKYFSVISSPNMKKVVPGMKALKVEADSAGVSPDVYKAMQLRAASRLPR